MKWLVALLLVQAACDDECIDGVCPDLDRTAHLLGPCESAHGKDVYVEHCRYEYDQQRITKIACDWDYHDGGTRTTTWAYDGTELVGIEMQEHVSIDRLGDRATRWEFTPTQVVWYAGSNGSSLRTNATYDRATFAFLPAPGEEQNELTAELGLVSRPISNTTFTWTRSGQILTRTGSNGQVATFQLDERDRIIRRTHVDLGDTTTWSFSGDRLIGRKRAFPNDLPPEIDTYTYDAGGNLAMREFTWGDLIRRSVYSYDCW
jgi:hypothetical protein